MKIRLALCLAAIVTLTSASHGDDWPEWRGKGRLGVWNESGIVDHFPADGLDVKWRVPVGSGYGGPAVAAGRVFVTDWHRTQGNEGVERVHDLIQGYTFVSTR